MLRAFKATAQFVGVLILICAAVCSLVLTAEFIMWIMDLHMQSCKS